MEKLSISVIVITKNAEETIEECLDSIQRNNPAEIIVVDGGSSDRTVDISRRYTERIYCDEGKGKGFARQLGAEQATQEYIAYIDSDIFLTEGALATMLTEFRSSDFVTMHALGSLRSEHPTYWERAQWQHQQLSTAHWHQNHVGTASGIFKRETILKYGFEPSYGGGMDDIDLEYKLRRDGHKFGVSSARIYFYFKRDFKSFVKTRFFWGKVALGYIRKYGIWHVRFWPPLRALYWLGFCLIKGKPGLIPYFVVDGIAETAGMVKGFLELTGEALKKPMPK